jgi:Multicopper oxidase
VPYSPYRFRNFGLIQAARPRNTREAMLSISLIILVPLALVAGLIGGQHLPPISSATATSSTPSPQASGMAQSSPGTPTSDQMDAMMAASIKAFPAKTAGGGGQFMQPAVQADGTKQYDLTTAITPWEVTPGHVVQAWTYNGTVPGPTIHVNVGDKVRVILHNKLPESTVIHFHGLIVPNAMDGDHLVADQLPISIHLPSLERVLSSGCRSPQPCSSSTGRYTGVEPQNAICKRTAASESAAAFSRGAALAGRQA